MTQDFDRGEGFGRRPLRIDPGVAAVIAAVIAAAGGVAGAFIGRATSPGNSAPKAVVTVTATPAVTVTVTAAAQGGTGGSGTDTQPGSTPPTAGSLLRQGNFTLTQGYCVDLDTSASNWSVSSDCGTASAINGRGDIRVDDLDIMTPGNADFAVLDQSLAGSFASCSSITDFTGELGQALVVPGLRLCVRTTSGNVALMKVSGVNNSGGIIESVSISVTVWKGQSSS